LFLSLPSGGVQVVVQGFFEHHFLPGASVAWDGFCKYLDETMAPMSQPDLWDFD